MLAEFRGFLTKTNALALAVGVIIGAAAGTVVTSLVGDILMPVVSLFLPSGDWREAKYVLSTATDANGEIIENAIHYGRFAGTLVNFIIVSFAVFIVVKLLVKPVPTPPAEPMTQCGECLEMIPSQARRCRACATVVTPG